MNRHGAVDIHERAHVWRQEGWQGFEGDTEMSQYHNMGAGTATDHSSDGWDETARRHRDGDLDQPQRMLIHDSEPNGTTISGSPRRDEIPPQNLRSEGSDTPVLPELPLLDEDLQKKYDYTADDFQQIEPITPRRKD